MKKNRSMVLLLAMAVNLLLSGPAISQTAKSSERPNIVLIFADDLGFMDVGFNGATYFETPHIDKLAKEGMQFTNAYASGANCAPSRACMISGQYTPRHGVYAVNSTSRGPKEQMRLAPVRNTTDLKSSVYTMAEALKSGGYTTGQFGKWHLGYEKNHTDPGSQGFDVFMESNADWKNNKQKIGEDPKGVFGITEAACKFITENKDKPFFAFVSHHAVHMPHQARPESLKKFEKKLAGNQDQNPLYAACIYDFDQSVGQILAHLKKLGLDKNTLVVFTSDNGGAHMTSQEPLRGNKGSFYEGGIREPFVVRWPGHIKAGSINGTPITNVDFFPTFATAANVKLPANSQLDGENLLPLFTGQKTTTTRDKIFWHFPGYLSGPLNRGRNTTWRAQPVTVMRKGDFKVMLYHEEWLLNGGWEKRATSNAIELYDLKSDPGEHRNIAATSPAKRDEMITDVLAWIKATDAPMASIKTPAQEKAMERAAARGKKKKGNKSQSEEEEDEE